MLVEYFGPLALVLCSFVKRSLFPVTDNFMLCIRCALPRAYLRSGTKALGLYAVPATATRTDSVSRAHGRWILNLRAPLFVLRSGLLLCAVMVGRAPASHYHTLGEG